MSTPGSDIAESTRTRSQKWLITIMTCLFTLLVCELLSRLLSRLSMLIMSQSLQAPHTNGLRLNDA